MRAKNSQFQKPNVKLKRNDFFFTFNYRGREDSVKRRKLRVQILLANPVYRLQKRGSSRSVPWSRDATHPSNPQHSYHDVHLRAYRVCLNQVAERTPENLA